MNLYSFLYSQIWKLRISANAKFCTQEIDTCTHNQRHSTRTHCIQRYDSVVCVVIYESRRSQVYLPGTGVAVVCKLCVQFITPTKKVRIQL